MTQAGPRDTAAVLTEFSQIMVEQRSVSDILLRLGDYCTELLPVDGVGILLRNGDGQLGVATANTPEGRAVEQLEVELREGPCTESLRSGQQVVQGDLAAAEERYPRFVPRALEAGVRSMHALSMAVRLQPIGSVDVIAREPRELSAEELESAQMLADVAISYIVATRRLERSSALAGQLQHALDSRVVLEQAKGVLAERHGNGVSEALTLLRQHARSTQTQLHTAALDVVEGRVAL
jgi:hypothetical protein